jgi:predicted nucleotidyltransferase
MSTQPAPAARLDELPLAALRQIADRYGVRDIRVFGSRARGEARPDSDLDLLVNIEYGRGVARRLVRFCVEASRTLGVKVDVVTEDGLDPVLHARILREARPL